MTFVTSGSIISVFMYQSISKRHCNVFDVKNTFQELGVPVATHKIEGPSTEVVFLGIILDTARFELRLPAAKLKHIQSLVETWYTRRSGPKREFESLLGHLSHTATVV